METMSSRKVLHSFPLLVFEYADADAEEVTTTTREKGMLMFSLSEQSIYTGMLPEIMAAKDNTCFSTPQGWIFVIGEVSEAWLWHPLTGVIISLPPIHEDHYIPVNCKCPLTHKSVADSDCAVVLIDVSDPNIWFCKVSGGQWGHHTYDIGGADSEDDSSSTKKEAVIGSVTAFRGKVHFTCTQSNQEKMCIVYLNFDPPTAVFHKFDVPNLEFPQDMCSGKIWLVESQDELLAVCVFFLNFDPDDIGAIFVYKMDFSDDKSDQKPLGWHRLHSVGDRAFLLSGTNMATWCSAPSAQHSSFIKGNAVYFLKNFWREDGDLCIYDLEEQTMEIVCVHDKDLVLPRIKPYWINVPPC